MPYEVWADSRARSVNKEYSSRIHYSISDIMPKNLRKSSICLDMCHLVTAICAGLQGLAAVVLTSLWTLISSTILCKNEKISKVGITTLI